MEQLQDLTTEKKSKQWFNVGRSVSLGELVGALVVIAYSAFSLEKRVSLIENNYKNERIEYAEFKKSVKADYNEFKTEIKEVGKDLNEIKLILKDKIDKK